MRTYKSIERKSTVLGMPAADLLLLLVVLVGLVLTGSVVGLFLPVGKLYYLASLVLVLGLLVALKYLNRKKHPSFIFSSLSFYWKQPRFIRVTGNSLHENRK